MLSEEGQTENDDSCTTEHRVCGIFFMKSNSLKQRVEVWEVGEARRDW